jgi:hypothetical protein
MSSLFKTKENCEKGVGRSIVVKDCYDPNITKVQDKRSVKT